MNFNVSFDGCDLRELAAEYGTPLYVMSETEILARCEEIRREFLEIDPQTRAVYAGKAFLTLEMCRILAREGLGIDVVSGGELTTAIRGGIDPAAIVFHGNNKSEEEYRMALKYNVGTYVVDSASDFDLLATLTEERPEGVPSARILFRINPGVDSHTHRYISTGHGSSKFGIAPEALLSSGLLLRAMSTKGIDLAGFHFHVGSQLTDNRSHLLAVDRLLAFVEDAGSKTGFVPGELNLGGGFGIRYEGDLERQPLSHFTTPMLQRIRGWFEETGFPQPLVTIEPGRFVVGEAGITLYRVGTVKDILTDGVPVCHVAVDGGFPDNPRTALYQARYEVQFISEEEKEQAYRGNVAGKCCESGDILVYDTPLPELKRGDLLAVRATGAYNHSMASNYNKIPRPAIVMVREGEHHLSVRRETYEDLLSRDL
ncbi:MAG: diaminopimelate decarboxylase [Firmicutes bacterium HGW-Firmicutes-11]|nr:MAG: diaminopimelate decarboxylase [Firmicutes bacterium HGW-Firmicutes-11]